MSNHDRLKSKGLDLVTCTRCNPPHRIQSKDLDSHYAALDNRVGRVVEKRRASSAKRQQRAAAKGRGW